MLWSRSSAGLLAAALASFSLSAAPAFAAPAPGTDQLLKELEADVAHKAALATPLEKARTALGRARSMDQVGDATHAALLRAVAREWLDLGKDMVRTADAEAKAEQKDKALDDLETKIVRGRALLEETVARRARAEALLEEVDRAAPTTTTAPQADKGADKSADKDKGKTAKPGAPAVMPPAPSPKAPPGAAPVPPPAVVPLPQSSPASTPKPAPKAPTGAPKAPAE